MTDTYTCAACGETYEKGLSDEQAAADLGETFPGFETSECHLVCDDCYKDMMGHDEPPATALGHQMRARGR